MEESHPISPERWLDEHGDVLFRFAMARVRDRETAEDLVQETFVAALRTKVTYAGRASERTWLVGILKNKIADYYRKKYRQPEIREADSGMGDEGFFQNLFDRLGHWREKPAEWSHPRSALQEKEFWTILRKCMHGLPERLASAFTLRIVEQCSTKEVCNIMNTTSTNVGVMLYRARLLLRRCLELNWFRRPREKETD